MLARMIKALLQPINTSAIILLGVYTIAWGLWVINPFWAVFTTAPLFHAMAAFLPEYIWGLIALVSGGLITYGVLKPSYPNLTRGAMVGFLHWGLIGVFYFVGDWMNTGGITALTFALYAAFVYLNIRINRVIPDQENKKRSGSNEPNPKEGE